MSDNISQTAVRNYRDLFSFKEFAKDTLAPIYFPDQEVSTLNIGTIGYTMEQIGTGIEDSFFTISTLIKEMFPNKAQLPESIYSYAAMFQLSNAFAGASECRFLLVFEEEMIRELIEEINLAENSNNNRFYIDRDTQIVVQDIIFTLDYDIEVTMKMINGETVYAAKYVTLPFETCISNITNPYIKVRKSEDNYLALEIIAHQCIRDIEEEPIINNSKINYPTIDIPFVGKLAGFDVLYKAPSDTDFNTQLITRVVDSSPLEEPFCYYKMKDESTLQISFSNMDTYFQPKFNSEIRVILYTTEGKNGNFEVYNGSNIDVICTSEKYWYNNNIVLAAKPIGSATGGSDKLSIDELQSLVVEQFSTSNALTTDADLEFFFRNYQYRYNNNIKFIKRRDDVAERLFSGYLIMKNEDYVYPTNTLDLSINYLDMYNPTKGYLYTLDPGFVFQYDGSRIDRVTPIFSKKRYEIETAYYDWCKFKYPDREYGVADKDNPFQEWKKKYLFLESYYEEKQETLSEKYETMDAYIHAVLYGDEIFPYAQYLAWDSTHETEILTIFSDEFKEIASNNTSDFYFVNPFLIALTVKPNIFGYYLTIVDQYSLVDFTNYNQNSFLQFIMNQLHVQRKLEEEKKYTFSIDILPSVKWEPEELVPTLFSDVKEVENEDGTVTEVPITYKENPLRVILAFKDNGGTECSYIELIPTGINEEDKVTFSGELYTDDHITASGNFRVIKNEHSKTPVVFMTNSDSQLLPMEDVVINIYTLYRDPKTTYMRLTDNPFVAYDPTLMEYVWTNIFDTYSDPITFIKPLNMIRSNIYFRDDRAVNINTGDVYVYSLPFMKYSLMQHVKETGEPDIEMEEKFNTFIRQFLLQYENLETVLNTILRNTSHIDLKFYNTYGKSKNYLIGEDEELIDKVNIQIKFDVYVGLGTDLVASKKELQRFIKAEVETINELGSNDLFISNLIRKIENNYSYVDHLRFRGINEYSTDYQNIRNITKDLNDLSKDERYKYIPEMLVCNTEDVLLTMHEVE